MSFQHRLTQWIAPISFLWTNSGGSHHKNKTYIWQMWYFNGWAIFSSNRIFNNFQYFDCILGPIYKLIINSNNDFCGWWTMQCLELNSDHIPSFDGILALLCNQEDYFEAYGWAIYCHKKFPKYQRAIDVILDVHNMLKDSPLLQK